MKKKILISVLVVLIICISSLVYLAGEDLFRYFYPGDDRAVFMQVEQGDSVLLQTRERENILIDGGMDNTVIYKLGKYIPAWDREIDLIILTHPHADHVTGLVEILRRYEVEKVLLSGVVHTLPAYTELMQEINNQNIEVIKPHEIDELLFTDLKLKILWPKEDLWAQDYEGELNNTSVVVKAIFNDNDSVLLTGDLEKEKELELIEVYGSELKSDILKAGHHGSKTSTSKEFLDAVNPEKIVFSISIINYQEYPHFRVLKNLEGRDIEILRTDKEGDVEIVIN